MPAHEVNFDGLVGPTHNYAGLSYGNIASTKHKLSVSSPRQAALQGIAKMKYLASLGLKQAVLPPHERPHQPTLRRLGFTGTDAQVLEQAAREDPALLAAVCSSSHMWAANAATVSPSADTADGRVHFTPANLLTQFHRSIEPPTTTAILRAIFHDPQHFVVHDPLPAASHFSDEGAANHTRLCRAYDEPGLEIFVYGRRAFDPTAPAPAKFPARQTYEASQALARTHHLDPARVISVQQNPGAIDAGAFHNDVVSVGNQNVLFYHEQAFADVSFPHRLAERWCQLVDNRLRLIRVPSAEVSLEEAVQSYVFNSQLLTLNGDTIIVAPVECRDHPRIRAFLDRIDQPFDLDLDFGARVHYVDVRQSMQNGGGPACLRLRVVLTDAELSRVHAGVMFDDELERKLVAWVEKYYRDRLEANDLRDPKLIDESRAALDALTQMLGLGSLYDFQRIPG